ncbi:MAG TPA: PepSY-associated TM helix domain-containing protein [Draconibacterium sp.]|nr:PepSY-associated TM helix domain-containing protein [Draconibacterium sp.]
MKKNWGIKIFKKLHKWPAIVIAFFAIVFAFSGIIMNHRQLFSPIDVSRKLLPSNYTYKNWNLAAVRGSTKTDSTSILMYGNIGIWKTEDDFKTFDDFNQGFPKGIDNRKIYSVVQHKNTLYAGTQLGLYKRNIDSGWEKIKLDVQEDRIADLALKKDTLLVLTRHYLLKSSNGIDFETIQLPEPVGYQRKTGLFETFWQLHSGELFGLPGKLLVDLLGLVTILLSVTGLLHFFFPKIIRNRKKKAKDVVSVVSAKKTNLRWHNVVGYIFAVFLIINTFAGMHLRPPLLIAIATKQVGIIPGTRMDSPNPWFDKLRRVQWDADTKQYIFSTADGFYFAEETLTKKLQPAFSQPPVSVMGCNVFKPIGDKIYLVGSFSGMFLWNIENGVVADFFTQQAYVEPEGLQSPIGANMAAGFIEGYKTAYWFDYNGGAKILSSQNTQMPVFPEMSEEIRKASPMSLWNVALEMHTGRIVEKWIGPFYILIVPLAGICILLVLISGFMLWWKLYRKR